VRSFLGANTVLLVASLALCALLGGCAEEESDAPLVAGGSYGAAGPSESALVRFCEAGASACDEVTEAQCAEIVIEAEKVVTTADLPCAQDATSCDDTAVCLDALAVVVVVDGGDMPTTMPAD